MGLIRLVPADVEVFEMVSVVLRTGVFLGIVLLLSLVGCRDAADEGPAPSPTGDSTAAATEERAPEPASRVDIPGTVAGMWWNQRELVKSLDLSRAQREQMDLLLADYLEPWMEMQRRRRSAPKQLASAYQEGDIETARRLAAGLGEAAAYLDGGVAALKAEVLAQLRPEQLQTFVAEHPQLLRRKWVVPGRVSPEGGGTQGRAGRRPARARQVAE